MPSWRDYVEHNRQRFVDELCAFLRIPSVSALGVHAADVRRAGEWAADRMRAAGIDHVEIWETGGHPVVYGDWLHAPDKPTVLIYGHFDTQPVDPLELWTTPPFEPTIRDGRVYARGASDDKGNMLIPIVATEALLASEGRLPVNVRFFFEGQEEIGSPQLAAVIAENRQRLRCDLVLNADVAQWSETEPALLMGLRGLCALQVDVRGPNSDLHSGTYGGAVQNPIHALAAILASLRSADGRVTVEGFYDQVRELNADERAAIAAVPLDEVRYKRDLGVHALFGEPGYTTLERVWVRPTLEVNGIGGGFQGEGSKTVLPSEAFCKITCRLVPDQDPVRVAEAVRAHILSHTPPGARVTVTVTERGAPAYVIPGDHWGNAAAERVLAAVYGRKPYKVRMGGSVPICSLFQDLLGVYSVGFGFGLEDEHIHAPNEFLRLSSFGRGQEAYALMLTELGGRGT